MPSGVPKLGYAVYQRQVRAQRLRDRVCVFCQQPIDRFTACLKCRTYQAEWKRRQRARRKEAA